jgi:hypothetical protein
MIRCIGIKRAASVIALRNLVSNPDRYARLMTT